MRGGPHKKKVLTLIFIFLFLAYPLCTVHGLTESDFLIYEDYLKFDFDDVGGPVTKAGYTSIVSNTLYSGGSGYGWVAGTLDLDFGSGDALLRDFCYTSSDRELKIDVDESTSYNFTYIMGHYTWYHDNIDVYCEGVLVLDDVTSTINNFVYDSFQYNITDGTINLVFHDDGGSDVNWVVNGLIIEKGVFDFDGWLQYQITENFGVLFVFILIFFCVAVGIAVSFGKRH